MTTIQDKLIALGATGAIVLLGAVTVIDSKEVTKLEPVEPLHEITIDIRDESFVVEIEDFQNVKATLLGNHQQNGYVDIMDMYGAGEAVFVEVLDTEIKSRGGVVWDGIESNDIEQNLIDLIAP